MKVVFGMVRDKKYMNVKRIMLPSLLFMAFIITSTISTVAIPHPISGYACYTDGVPAAEATVDILNLDTQEHIYTTVLTTGDYMFDTGGFSSAWKDGNILLISITQENNVFYSGWTENTTITINQDLLYQNISNIILKSPSSSVSQYPPLPPSQPSGATTGYSNQNYHYISTATDPDNDQLYYWFDWDDGTNSGWVGPYPSGGTVSSSKTWTTPGTYNIRAKVKDEYGNENDWSSSLTVTITKQDTGQNTAPIAQMSYLPITPTTQDTIQLTDQSTDLDGTIISWQWDFGDGVYSTEKNTHHQYNISDTYIITLYVTDDDGATSSAAKTITVREKPNDEKITGAAEEISNHPFFLIIFMIFLIILIITIFYFLYYKSRQKKKTNKEIVTKAKDKKITKIALCPKCKTHVPVSGTKGQKFNLTCPNCNAKGFIKI